MSTVKRPLKIPPSSPINLEKYDITAGDRDAEGAEYRIEVNTDFTEPGFNVGVVRKNAAIDLTCKVYNIATGEEVAVIKIKKSSANDFLGTDFDTGYRIQECYAKAGRELAKFFIKKAKLKYVFEILLAVFAGFPVEHLKVVLPEYLLYVLSIINHRINFYSPYRLKSSYIAPKDMCNVTLSPKKINYI